MAGFIFTVMAKDPAFLFYSNDFYEGTRTMFPEERACFIDLLIYQHQNGYIPNDTRRLLLYCSGVNEATLIATLQAKFKQTDKGWINDKLNIVIEARAKFAAHQSSNGRIGQFFKKANNLLPAKTYKRLRELVNSVDKEDFINDFYPSEITLTTLIATLQGLLKHLEIENVIIDINGNIVIEEKKDSIIKNKFGEKEKVLLSEEEYYKLADSFGQINLDIEISSLENYIVNGKGGKYKDHYLVLKNWLTKRKTENNGNTIAGEDISERLARIKAASNK